MSKAKLKKYLQTLSKEQVIEVMIELYDARKEVKEYLEFYLAPDSNAELEKCRVLPYPWFLGKALIRKVQENHFRFPKTEN